MNIDRARLFDKRVVQRNIRAGRVTKDEYRAWLAEMSESSDKIKARDEGGDEDGYDHTPVQKTEPHVHAELLPRPAPIADPFADPFAEVGAPESKLAPPSGEAG